MSTLWKLQQAGVSSLGAKILLFIVIVTNNESKWRIISRGEFVQQRHKLIS